MRVLVFLIGLLYPAFTYAQSRPVPPEKPKIIVGVVLDQMRWDYLYRYESRYTANGFKRLLREGFSYDNAMIPYVPTYTAVGHTTLYTGSVPALHGIVGNNWYDKKRRVFMYCTSDSTVTSVGGTASAGKQSPRNLWATTITDELRLASNFKNKVIGISLKDRGGILPAGHSANAAYWYDAGKWITSSYYMKELPAWVSAFNAKDRVGEMMKTDWNTLYPINTYVQSTADENTYEGSLAGLKSAVFPHKLSSIGAEKYDALRTTPYGNTLTFEFAKEAIENEKLGMGKETDFLAVSFSSPDYIGHTFGPNSIEAEDSYLRFDKEFAEFLTYLDKKYGKGNYLLFLSADHAAAHVPGFLNDHGIPAGVFSTTALRNELNKNLDSLFGISMVVDNVMNDQVYINQNLINQKGADREKIIERIIFDLQQKDFIMNAWDMSETAEAPVPEPVKTAVMNTYTTTRSGDIQFFTKPGYFSGGSRGTTHGNWNPYDSHIPLIFFGWKVPHGSSDRKVFMTDLAPTLAAKLKIQMPNAAVGNVLEEVSKN